MIPHRLLDISRSSRRVAQRGRRPTEPPAGRRHWALSAAVLGAMTALCATALAQPRGTPTATASTTKLTVNVNQPIRPFSAAMRGANLGNWTFYWGRPYPNDSPKLRALTKLIKPGVLRYAGGLASNKVKWDRTNPQCYPYRPGAQCNRGPFIPARTATDHCTEPAREIPKGYTYVYQADEIDALVKFARHVGAEIMIEVNVRACDTKMWADMVRYANVEHDYNIRYWELGNEFDLKHATGDGFAPVGDDYIKRFLRYAHVLKAVDPSIQIAGPTTASYIAGPPFHPFRDFIDPLLKSNDVKQQRALNLFTYHYYPLWNGRRQVALSELLNWQHTPPPGVQANPKRGRSYAAEAVRLMRKRLDDNGHRTVPVAITELNTVAADRPTPWTFNHAAALNMADMLGRLAYAGADMALHWELYDQPGVAANQSSFGLMSHNGSTYSVWPPTGKTTLQDKFTPMPVYYTYFMYAQFFADLLVQSDSSQPQDLSVWASIPSKQAGKVRTARLMVVNLSNKAITSTVQVQGLRPRRAILHTLTNPDFVAANEPSKRDIHGGTRLNGRTLDTTSAQSIKTSARAIRRAGQKRKWPRRGDLLHTFPPYSATSIIVR